MAALSIAIGLLGPGGALGASVPRPTIGIGAPANAAALYYDATIPRATLFYDPTTQSLPVGGGFTGLPKRLVDANAITIVVGSGPSSVRATIVPTGETKIGPLSFYHGIFAAPLPLPFDLLWPLRRIEAAVLDSRRRVLARDVIHVWDFRGHGDAVSDLPVETSVRAMTAQVTDAGVGYVPSSTGRDGLEPTVFRLLPYPSLDDLNDRLTNRALEIPDYDDDADLLEDCIPYEDLTEPNFSDPLAFPAFGDAYGAAFVAFQAFTFQRQICEGLQVTNPPAAIACFAGLAAYCVQDYPTAADFELCVDQVEGEATSLTVEAVDDLSLRVRPPLSADTGRVDSDVTITGLRGTITGRLRSLYVRWKETNPLCIAGIRANFDDAGIPERPWLDDWATCEDLELRNELASTELGAEGNGAPGQYVVEADPSDVERPLVQLGVEGTFGFDEPSIDAARGTCGLDAFIGDVEPMIRTFRQPMQTRLQNTWYRTPPDTPEAQVLTKLFSVLEPGDHPITDADIATELTVNHSEPEGGLGFRWDAVLETMRPDLIANRKPLAFDAPPRAPSFEESAQDHLGEPFEYAYTITTGLLNKVLNVRAASPDTLHLLYEPTWAELAPFGVRTPAGADPEAPAVLDRRTLSRLDRAFGSIGRAVLRIRVSPVIDPIVYMSADVPPQDEIPNVGAPLAYGIAQFRLDFFEAAHTDADGAPVPEKTWVRLLGGFIDRDFRLDPPSDPAAIYLLPRLDEHPWGFTIVENRLRGAFALPGLERNVSALVDARFTPVFEQMLSEIPMPRLFDAAGESSRPRIFDFHSLQQQNQNVTWFGGLVPP